MERESDGNTNCYRRTRYSHQRIFTGTGRLVNKGTNGDHPNDGKQPEYLEESWRLEETCCHSNFNVRGRTSTAL